jgi:hypothetical protein
VKKYDRDAFSELTTPVDPAEAIVPDAPAGVPDGRPLMQAISGARPAVVSPDGKATVSLKPWGTMILAPAAAK